MRRQQKNITLTDSQKKYVRDNYNHMTTYEMAQHLKITQTKVFVNMKLMGLEIGVKKQPIVKNYSSQNGCFNVHAESNWVL